MSTGSVPRYTDILVELVNTAESAIDVVISKAGTAENTIGDFREAVVSEFVMKTDPFIKNLPDSCEYGATVTLRDYGYRNRDDIVRRIRLGKYKEVEEAFTRIALR